MRSGMPLPVLTGELPEEVEILHQHGSVWPAVMLFGYRRPERRTMSLRLKCWAKLAS